MNKKILAFFLSFVTIGLSIGSFINKVNISPVSANIVGTFDKSHWQKGYASMDAVDLYQHSGDGLLKFGKTSGDGYSANCFYRYGQRMYDDQALTLGNNSVSFTYIVENPCTGDDAQVAGFYFAPNAGPYFTEYSTDIPVFTFRISDFGKYADSGVYFNICTDHDIINGTCLAYGNCTSTGSLSNQGMTTGSEKFLRLNTVGQTYVGLRFTFIQHYGSIYQVRISTLYAVSKLPSNARNQTALTSSSSSAVYYVNMGAAFYSGSNTYLHVYGWDSDNTHSASTAAPRMRLQDTTATTSEAFPVYYNSKGGSFCASDVADYIGGKGVTLPSPTKTGYSLAGWYNGSTRVGGGGDTYRPTSSCTLEASWTLNKYTASFSCNYGSWAASSKEVYYDDQLSLSGNTVSKSGYSTAWSNVFTPATATAQYNYSSPSFTNATSKITGNITVTASQTRSDRTYTVKWYNGSTLLETDTGVGYNATYTYNGSTPTKSSTAQYSYTFKCWGLGSETGTDVYSGSTKNAGSASTTTINLYAKFNSTVRSYAVNLNAGTGYTAAFFSDSASATSGSSSGSSVEYGSIVYGYFSLNNGYSNSSLTQVGSYYRTGSYTVSGTTSISSGNATAITYSIAYDLDGGSVSSANPASYTIESNNFTLNNPSKPGYTFAGWTGTGLSSATETVTVTKGSTGDRSYTATYTKNSYMVTIYKNDYGENYFNIYMEYDSIVPILNPYSRTGYTLEGIYENSDFTGTKYYDSSFAQLEKYNKASDSKMYTNWTANTYNLGIYDKRVIGTYKALEHVSSVGFYANGSYVSPWTYDVSNPITTKTMSKGGLEDSTSIVYYKIVAATGYHFVRDGVNYSEISGYAHVNERNLYANNDGGEHIISDSNLYIGINAPVGNTYTISYQGNAPTGHSGDVSGLPSDQQATYDSNVTLGSAPSLKGYSFTGWYNDSEVKSKIGDANETLTKPNFATSGTYNLYAGWQGNYYTFKSYTAPHSKAPVKFYSDAAMENEITGATFGENVLIYYYYEPEDGYVWYKDGAVSSFRFGYFKLGNFETNWGDLLVIEGNTIYYPFEPMTSGESFALEWADSSRTTLCEECDAKGITVSDDLRFAWSTQSDSYSELLAGIQYWFSHSSDSKMTNFIFLYDYIISKYGKSGSFNDYLGRFNSSASYDTKLEDRKDFTILISCIAGATLVTLIVILIKKRHKDIEEL